MEPSAVDECLDIAAQSQKLAVKAATTTYDALLDVCRLQVEKLTKDFEDFHARLNACRREVKATTTKFERQKRLVDLRLEEIEAKFRPLEEALESPVSESEEDVVPKGMGCGPSWGFMVEMHEDDRKLAGLVASIRAGHKYLEENSGLRPSYVRLRKIMAAAHIEGVDRFNRRLTPVMTKKPDIE